MNAEKAKWSRRYRTALRKHLSQGPGASLQPALGLGRQAVALGLETLDLAGLHEQALMSLVSPDGSSRARQGKIERAKNFFAETIVPIEETHRAALKTAVRVNQLTQTLHRRTAESAASTRHLKRDIVQRLAAEATLKKSGERHARHLADLRRLQRHLREMTLTRLPTQEDRRQKMSLQLQDEIAQSLIAINLRLLTLKKATRTNTASLKKEIASTQRLVRDCTARANRVAYEFGIADKT